MNIKKLVSSVGLRQWLLLGAVLLPALAMADSTADSQSIYAYGWRIVNFLCGISAVILIGDIAWHARDMTEHGRRVKTSFMGLGLLAVLYAVAAFVLSSGDAQGTDVSGISAAMQMKP